MDLLSAGITASARDSRVEGTVLLLCYDLCSSSLWLQPWSATIEKLIVHYNNVFFFDVAVRTKKL